MATNGRAYCDWCGELFIRKWKGQECCSAKCHIEQVEYDEFVVEEERLCEPAPAYDDDVFDIGGEG